MFIDRASIKTARQKAYSQIKVKAKGNSLRRVRELNVCKNAEKRKKGPTCAKLQHSPPHLCVTGAGRSGYTAPTGSET